jgi:integrase
MGARGPAAAHIAGTGVEIRETPNNCTQHGSRGAPAVLQRGSEHIFLSPMTGHPFASLFYPWDRIRRRAGLPDLRLHDLRHSFASFLVNGGVSLYVVQGLLGHSQARMTQRYAHLAPQTLLNATEVVAGVIGSSHQNGALPV